jgi:hypothetical protein
VELILFIHVERDGVELQKMFEFGGVFHGISGFPRCRLFAVQIPVEVF